MKRTSTLSIALPLSFAALITMFARTQMLEFWTGQSASSPTNVSLTVIASAGSSSSVSSNASSASSSAQSSAASSESTQPPQGRYRYSEELTMERLIPLLKKRFLQPAAPRTPTLEPVLPYYKPLRSRMSLERDLLNFGTQMRADAEGLFLWPQHISSAEPLHFFLWGDIDAWHWEYPFLAKEEPLEPDLHAAAENPHWLWMDYASAMFGSHVEPWLWLLFLLFLILTIIFSRRILDRIVDTLVWIKKRSDLQKNLYG